MLEENKSPVQTGRGGGSTNKGSYVPANALDIYYEEYGSGAPLVLIHGGCLNLNSWSPYIPTFVRHFRVFTFDSRGHGRTKNPAGTMSYRLLADDTAAFIRALGLQRPLVCGYSDGGQIALEMGMNYPGLAKAYVVGGATYHWSDEYFAFFKAFGIDGPGCFDPERAERNLPDFVKLARDNDLFQGEGYWKTLVRNSSFMWLQPLDYLVEDLRKIIDPTLLLAGDRDSFFMPVEDAVHLYRSIPGAELAVAPGCDHMFPFFNTEMFTNLAIGFLLRHAAD
jgi:pimeloyl-ACP methyl ester carboxylesterase